MARQCVTMSGLHGMCCPQDDSRLSTACTANGSLPLKKYTDSALLTVRERTNPWHSGFRPFICLVTLGIILKNDIVHPRKPSGNNSVIYTKLYLKILNNNWPLAIKAQMWNLLAFGSFAPVNGTQWLHNREESPFVCLCIYSVSVLYDCFSPLFIQKVIGGGRPGGGLQGKTSGEPSLTTIGSSTSLGHSGASGGWRAAEWEKQG